MRINRSVPSITIVFAAFVVSLPTNAVDFAGGTGEPNDPYQIATAEQLIGMGADPNLYHKSFVLIADIDLSSWVFDQAVIAPGQPAYYWDRHWSSGRGKAFLGLLDGNGHRVIGLTINGQNSLGLIGRLDPGAVVTSLEMDTVVVNATEGHVGSIVAFNNGGVVSDCCSYGMVSGDDNVGGLVGTNNQGYITNCHSEGMVSGKNSVGGLVGFSLGCISSSSSGSMVKGNWKVGGLVGSSYGSILNSNIPISSIMNSYSTGMVSGHDNVGGLAGNIAGYVINCYSIGMVSGDNNVGALVGYNSDGSVSNSFWDIETSGLAESADGIGLSTTEMQDVHTFLNAGWDYVDEKMNGTCQFWTQEPNTYPVLSTPKTKLNGMGLPGTPYVVTDAYDLGAVCMKPWATYRLEADIDFSGVHWNTAVIPWFVGTFDGNGYCISDLKIQGTGNLGLFGTLSQDTLITKLGLLAVDVNGTENCVGALVAYNKVGTIAMCYSTGTVSGCKNYIGGLVGYNGHGMISSSYSDGAISAHPYSCCVGGLVGYHLGGFISDSYSSGVVNGYNSVGGLVGGHYGAFVSNSYSNATVNGHSAVGGLVGLISGGAISNSCSSGVVSGISKSECYDIGGLVGHISSGSISNSYSSSMVSGDWCIGGLVGINHDGSITKSYSNGMVSGVSKTGGLIGGNNNGSISNCFWDAEHSGITHSEGGVILSTAEMMDPQILSLNGLANDPNWVLDAHRDYPRLAWQGTPGQIIPSTTIDWLNGDGSPESPFEISTADQLVLLSKAGVLVDRYFVLMNDLDLSQLSWPQAVVPYFTGHFDGQGYSIRHLTIKGEGHLGLFGFVDENSFITDLCLEMVDVNGVLQIGGLAGFNKGRIMNSSSSGKVHGGSEVGGLVGLNTGSINNSSSNNTVSGDGAIGGFVGCNDGSVTNSFSVGMVSGRYFVGGLAGLLNSLGSISNCYSNVTVEGHWDVGGLVGYSMGPITNSFSIAKVSGDSDVGGLVGNNDEGSVSNCYSKGVVSGSNRAGGLVGEIQSGSISSSYSTCEVKGNAFNNGLVGGDARFVSNSFWNTEISSLDKSEGGTGLTTTQMQDINTYLDASWDFSEIWMVCENDYPHLQWEGIQCAGETVE